MTTLRMDNNKTLESCIEAVRRHDLVLARQHIQDHRLLKIRRLAGMEDVSDEAAVAVARPNSYIEPEVWNALTPEQRRAIIRARQEDGNKSEDDSKSNPKSKREKRTRAWRAKLKAKRDAKQKKKDSQKADGEDRG